MSPVTAQCARCGAQITFRVDEAVVTVCEYCNAVNARTDRGFEDLGQVADLVDTRSPLSLWLEGSHEGVGLFITGRAQVRHGAGGIWDEWYVKMDDGRWGWLAEAQGRFFLTFKIEEPGGIPAFEELAPGHTIGAGGKQFVVAECGEAQMLSAEGDIPYMLEPGRQFQFADIQAPDGSFATIDYGDDPPAAYLGREVTLAELGISPSAPAQEAAARQVESAGMFCPNCNGSLELAAPDQTERVACPYCDSLLDVNQGNLTFLKALHGPKVPPQIPLGTVGTVRGHELKVIGFMQRSVTFFGVKYYWEEYLLYEPKLGFRWLTCSDSHWSYVEPVNVAAVKAPTDYYSSSVTAEYGDKRYRIYQDAVATVEYVSGEFYWKVEAGETVKTCDFINPPEVLSQELSDREINYSVGTYMAASEVEDAFGIELKHRPFGTVAPHQPYRHKGIYKVWAAMLGLLLVAAVVVGMTRNDEVVYQNDFVFEPAKSSSEPTVVFGDSFELDDGQNVEIQAASPVNNSWVYLMGDLFNEETGVVQQFDVPIEYYHGVSGGERWSEGSQSSKRYVSALPSGTYTLRLAVERKDWRQPASVRVRIKQGVFRWKYLLFGLIGISIVPLIMAFHHFTFEKRRWKDSDYAPGWATSSEEE